MHREKDQGVPTIHGREQAELKKAGHMSPVRFF
jgi:hypothetical protein